MLFAGLAEAPVGGAEPLPCLPPALSSVHGRFRWLLGCEGGGLGCEGGWLGWEGGGLGREGAGGIPHSRPKHQ